MIRRAFVVALSAATFLFGVYAIVPDDKPPHQRIPESEQQILVNATREARSMGPDCHAWLEVNRTTKSGYEVLVGCK